MTDTVRKENSLWNRQRMILRCHGYLCTDLLGEGAFSHVYRVEKREDGKIYACKISENTAMLEREATFMSRLRHPLFPAYHDFWASGDTGFLVREYIPGESLKEIISRLEFLPPPQIIRMGVTLAEGLSYLHNMEEQFLLRDIKPANIILRPDRGVKLIDLGCMCPRRDSANSRAGSAGFAAPEQLRGGCMLTPACDVYGLGQTLKAAWGREGRGIFRQSPRTGKTEQKSRAKETRGNLKSEETQRQLARILDMCTDENPQRRIQDMESVRLALKDLKILL